VPTSSETAVFDSGTVGIEFTQLADCAQVSVKSVCALTLDLRGVGINAGNIFVYSGSLRIVNTTLTSSSASVDNLLVESASFEIAGIKASRLADSVSAGVNEAENAVFHITDSAHVTAGQATFGGASSQTTPGYAAVTIDDGVL
jgi:hypothetical protein